MTPRHLALAVGAVLGVAVAGTWTVADSDDSGATTLTAQESRVPDVPRDRFTVVASGDVLIHPEITEQAVADAGGGAPDFRAILDGVAPAVGTADLALCHLEIPLAAPEGPVAGWPDFNAPPQIAAALADTGYDSCTTASNHTLDQGRDGVVRTLDTLDAAGLAHTGSARSAAEAATPLVHDLGGVRVGQVSFTYGYNGRELPADTPWLANTLDVDAVLSAARAARAAGADVVIASLHWGVEFQHEPTQEQQDIAARLLADPDVDLIIGHHAHVVQPFARVGSEWVAYGLGNHLARHAEPRGSSEEGVLARFTFARDGSGQWQVDLAEYLPTLIDLGPPIRVLELSTAPRTPAVTAAIGHVDSAVRSMNSGPDVLLRPGQPTSPGDR